LPLVVAGTRDRPRPPRRRRRGQGPFAIGALVLTTAEPAADGKVAAGHPAKVLADRAQHLLVGGVHPKPGADVGTDRRGDHERGSDPTHQQ
jgi:hypothetical protein